MTGKSGWAAAAGSVLVATFMAAFIALLALSACAPASTAPQAAPSAPPPVSTAPSSSSPSPSAETSAPAQPSASKSALPSAKPVEVAETLRFESTTVDGKKFDGATLAGKPVLFWFWAPWCPTCKAQIPEVQKLAKAYEGKVTVIGVGSQDNSGAIKGFADNAWGMTHLSDADGKTWKHFGVVEQSSFLLLDTKGAKAFSTGYGGSDKLTDEVARVAG